MCLILSACSTEEEEVETLYDFPSLSQEQLRALKKQSESLEGFFITTDLSDGDPSYADRGFYLYVCVRFLNDPALNNLLKKSAIPLLIQASNDPLKPSAETLLLFHPQTKKSEGEYQFYYEEPQHFSLTFSPILIQDIEYVILDPVFNSAGRLKNMSFLKKNSDLKSLKRPVTSNSEKESVENPATTEEKEVTLKVAGFAKQFSSSCKDWSILNYAHSSETPDYLKVDSVESKDSSSPTKEVVPKATHSPSTSSSPTEVPPQALIPETAPHTQTPKTNSNN